MTPREFRDLPRQDQIEMMAAKREEGWRESLAQKANRIVADRKKAAAGGDSPAPRRTPRR
jgi:hypothetical protein